MPWVICTTAPGAPTGSHRYAVIGAPSSDGYVNVLDAIGTIPPSGGPTVSACSKRKKEPPGAPSPADIHGDSLITWTGVSGNNQKQRPRALASACLLSGASSSRKAISRASPKQPCPS